jgi:protein-export membrane protein SecD
VGEPIGIFLDEELITAPEVQQRITGGIATITGQRDIAEAQELASLLNAGALPVNLVELQAQSVGASLGQRSLEQGVWAGIIGGVVVLIFMLCYYRLPGLVADISLLVYTYLLLLLFQLLGVTLTLAGIAAFILALGMAVDANILTAERIKEEIRAGKSIPSALRAGSRRALVTILDANITTVLAAAVIYYLGSGSVRGFATTLILSILLSILTNVWISRLLLQQSIKAGIGVKPWHFGVKEEEISEL